MKEIKRKKLLLLLAAALICFSVGCLCLHHDRSQTAGVLAGKIDLNGFVILVDAGHGGMDGGAVGYQTKVCEAELNLSIALKLKEILESCGAKVVLTRSDGEALGNSKDADMQKRREIIETSGQDITVSIHQNSFPDHSANGPQTICAHDSEEGAKLATVIQEELVAALKPKRPREIMPGNYFIVNSGEAPAVIVECGFISNEQEELLLQDEAYQQKIAEAIVLGIDRYLGGK